ncbi:hypothetical protein [Reinekea blandensis]|uniref:Uncharacterized protein n=1 Tax=Reinekea blandensis MED297 TaxID=314283 RepID=A4BES6_9GAMM|nr:hypothetical protein [Reinekea blandensis]EAR09261.1 hypothetical protein MED297_18273 [Reinekea sp. MED297] [Reinekea blandensis MED297]
MKLALFSVVLLLFFATGVVTLLGIIKRLDIERKYLNALFSAFLLELTAAVLILFSSTDFFAESGLTPQESAQIAVIQEWFADASPDAIRQQLTEWQSQNQEAPASVELTQALDEATQQVSSLERTLEQKQQQIKWLEAELDTRREAVLRLSRLERQFLVRVADLNSKISEWGSSINFRWQPEDKRDVALMLQEAFKEIGFMPELEIPNDDPLLAHDILVRYQRSKDFKEVGFLTHQTVAFIVQDYLTSANAGVN